MNKNLIIFKEKQILSKYRILDIIKINYNINDLHNYNDLFIFIISF